MQGGNVSAQFIIDSVVGVGGEVATYTITDAGSDYVTGDAELTSFSSGSGGHINIDGVSGSGSGYRNNVH